MKNISTCTWIHKNDNDNNNNINNWGRAGTGSRMAKPPHPLLVMRFLCAWRISSWWLSGGGELWLGWDLPAGCSPQEATAEAIRALRQGGETSVPAIWAAEGQLWGGMEGGGGRWGGDDVGCLGGAGLKELPTTHILNTCHTVTQGPIKERGC